jgi:hypothetical protein
MSAKNVKTLRAAHESWNKARLRGRHRQRRGERTSLSSIAGTASGRRRPSAFSMYTLLEGVAR